MLKIEKEKMRRKALREKGAETKANATRRSMHTNTRTKQRQKATKTKKKPKTFEQA
jgi:hypothetical protein